MSNGSATAFTQTQEEEMMVDTRDPAGGPMTPIFHHCTLRAHSPTWSDQFEPVARQNSCVDFEVKHGIRRHSIIKLI